MLHTSIFRTPSYRKHKGSGQAVVTLNGREIYLGKHGTPASKAEYDRLIAIWLANGRRLPNDDIELTVNELALEFWKHAERYFRFPDGSLSKEIGHYKRCLRLLCKLHGNTPANKFGPVSLRIIRDHMISLGWVRKSINTHLYRLKNVFRWGGEQGLVRPTVFHGLLCVSGLRTGRSEAKESVPVKPEESMFHIFPPYFPSPTFLAADAAMSDRKCSHLENSLLGTGFRTNPIMRFFSPPENNRAPRNIHVCRHSPLVASGKATIGSHTQIPGYRFL